MLHLPIDGRHQVVPAMDLHLLVGDPHAVACFEHAHITRNGGRSMDGLVAQVIDHGIGIDLTRYQPRGQDRPEL